MRRVHVTKEFKFESAHKLDNYEGDCSRLHGHSYKLQVTVSGLIDPDFASTQAVDYMVIDFKELNKIVNKNIIESHDHEYLNNLYTNPTAEIMVLGIFDTLKEVLPKDLKLESVKLWETETSFAEYKGE